MLHIIERTPPVVGGATFLQQTQPQKLSIFSIGFFYTQKADHIIEILPSTGTFRFFFFPFIYTVPVLHLPFFHLQEHMETVTLPAPSKSLVGHSRVSHLARHTHLTPWSSLHFPLSPPNPRQRPGTYPGYRHACHSLNSPNACEKIFEFLTAPTHLSPSFPFLPTSTFKDRSQAPSNLRQPNTSSF